MPAPQLHAFRALTSALRTNKFVCQYTLGSEEVALRLKFFPALLAALAMIALPLKCASFFRHV